MRRMWTKDHRERQKAFERRCYPTDLTALEWERVRPILPQPTRRGRRSKVTLREILNAIRLSNNRQHRGLNSRAENSYQLTRRRERVMKRFKSAGQAQRFLSVHDQVANFFRALPTPALRSSSYPHSGLSDLGRDNGYRECRLIQPRIVIKVSYSDNLTVPLLDTERGHWYGSRSCSSSPSCTLGRSGPS